MSDQYVGEIRMFGGDFAPEGWLLCNGAQVPVATYEALYALIGTTYGGSGPSFALPDLRGRVPISHGQAPGLTSYPLGASGGAEQVALTVAEYPAHTHVAQASTETGNQASTERGIPAANGNLALYNANTPKYALNTAAVGMSGGGSQPHENRQPFMVLNFIISYTGVYPVRP